MWRRLSTECWRIWRELMASHIPIRLSLVHWTLWHYRIVFTSWCLCCPLFVAFYDVVLRHCLQYLLQYLAAYVVHCKWYHYVSYLPVLLMLSSCIGDDCACFRCFSVRLCVYRAVTVDIANDSRVHCSSSHWITFMIFYVHRDVIPTGNSLDSR